MSDVAAGSRESTHRAVVAASVLAMVAVCVVCTVLPMGIRWDFANFYDAGRKVVAGQVADLYDPTAAIAGEPPQGKLDFFGFPISAVLYAPMALLAPSAALAAFKIFNALVLGASLWLLHAQCGGLAGPARGDRLRFAARFCVMALAFQPLWTVFRVGGQMTHAALLLLIVGGPLHARGRTWASAACFSAAVLVKPILAPGLVALALLSGRAFLVRTAVMWTGVAVVSLATMGLAVHEAFLASMRNGASRSVIWYFNSGLTTPIEDLRLLTDPARTSLHRPPALAAAVFAVRAAVCALAVAVAVRARRRDLAPGVRARFDWLLATLFALLVAPVVWEHYLAWLFPLLACLAALGPRLSAGARALVVATVATAVGQNLEFVNWLADTVAPQSAPALVAVGLFKATPLLLSAILLWRHLDDVLGACAEPGRSSAT